MIKAKQALIDQAAQAAPDQRNDCSNNRNYRHNHHGLASFFDSFAQNRR